MQHSPWGMSADVLCVAAEDVITRLIPPQAAAPAQSADQVADQACGPAHPALWASLVEQASFPAPAPPSAPTPSAKGTSLQHSREGLDTPSGGLEGVGQMKAAAPYPSYPLRYREAGARPCTERRKIMTNSLPQLPSQVHMSAACHVNYGPTLLAPSSGRQSMPSGWNNILPLRRPVQSSSGSKLGYNSNSSSSSTEAAPTSSYHDSRHPRTACASRDQSVSETHKSSASVYGGQQQQQQQQLQQQQQQISGLWTHTSQLARLVSFPVRVTRAYYSYVPLGQQLYLNPQSVTTSLHSPADPPKPHLRPDDPTCPAVDTAQEHAAASGASAAAASSVAELTKEAASAQLHTVASVPAALADMVDSVVLQRKEQLGRLWMHRMPTYRARIQQIFFAAQGLPLPALHSPALAAQDLDAETDSSRLSKPIAPEIRVVTAEACAKGLLTSTHLRDMLQVSYCSKLAAGLQTSYE